MEHTDQPTILIVDDALESLVVHGSQHVSESLIESVLQVSYVL